MALEGAFGRCHAGAPCVSGRIWASYCSAGRTLNSNVGMHGSCVIQAVRAILHWARRGSPLSSISSSLPPSSPFYVCAPSFSLKVVAPAR
jgi:hypothetical protein